MKETELSKELEEIARETYVGWKAVLQFRDTVEGGVPKDPEMIRTWILAKVSKGELKMEPQEVEELIRTTAQEVIVQEEEAEEETSKEQVTRRKLKASWCGFKSDENGLYIEARQVHAMLKECANTLKLTRQIPGLRQVLQHGTHIKPVKIYLSKKEPDGIREAIAQTRFGSAFKRNDYVKNAEITVEIYYADVGFLSDDNYKKVMVVAQENGLGANRSQGVGKFDILQLEKIQGERGKKVKPSVSGKRT